MKPIDKDAVIAEIERRKEECDTFYNIALSNNAEFAKVAIEEQKKQYDSLLSFLDTLEVKEVDLEKDVRQILSLYYEGIKHYEDIIKEEREENGGSDLAIKIMDGVVDARELGIQYVIDKLKVQKGEEL